MLRLRFDVDYAFNSRFRSVLNMAGYRANHWCYLMEAKNIATLINQSEADVKAFWFFTPYTLPDKALLSLLSPDKHEIGLHAVNDPLNELELLRRVAGRNISYYTIHGTSRLLAQLVWNRGIGQKQVNIPKGFPCKSFHAELTHSLDRACYGVPNDVAVKDALERIEGGFVLAAHPEWVYISNGKDRGPYYCVLHKLLEDLN